MSNVKAALVAEAVLSLSVDPGSGSVIDSKSTAGGPPCYSVIITLTGHNFLTTHTTNAGHKAAPRWQKPPQWVFKLQFL